jgi:NAD(P)H dehydrogenase (quinone)
MRVLIIGALGNLAYLTTTKLASSYPYVHLRLTSHRATGLKRLQAEFPHADVAQADWNDAASLRSAVRGVDRVLVVMTDWVIDESIATPNLIRALENEGRVETVLRFIALPPGLKAERLAPDVLATRAGAMLTLVAKPLLDASQLPICYVNASCWIGFNIDWFYGQDIRASGQIRMPADTDTPRQWVTEGDLSDAFVRILTEAPVMHVGREYRVAGGPNYTYAEQASLIGRVLAKDVRWVDDDSSLRRIMGDKFEKLLTYLLHEVEAYRSVPQTRQLELLLGRDRTSLETYVEAIRTSLV